VNHNLPIPFEDELAMGLLGRFARLNGMTSVEWAIKSIKGYFQEDEHLPTLWLIAKAYDQDRCEFTAKHSMIPVLYPISRIGGSRQESSKHHANLYGLAASASGVRWCPECAHLDRKERGFGHWRRVHQINGIDWCNAHQLPLVSAPAESTILAPGHPATKGPTALSQTEIDHELGYQALQRLQEILVAWLQRPQPIHLRAWGEVVSQRCRNMGLRMGEIGKRAVASDLILEQFPHSWLSRHMPEVAIKHACSCVRKVDGACIDRHVAYPALACAAILAVLFDSTEEALATLDSANQRVIAELQPQGTVDRALAAFKAGLGLIEACKRFDARVQDVEAELRSGRPERRQLKVA